MQTKKRYLLSAIIILVMLLTSLTPVWADDEEDAPVVTAEPVLTAVSAILIDANSGRVLYEHNAYQPLPMASLTKMYTALLVLENIEQLSQKVTVPDDFINVGESSMDIKPGETYTVEELLYGMMLRSGNDAAQVLGYAVSGSEAAFIDLMNIRGAELGFTRSSWRNPHGLHHDEHVSTAYELAQIARLAGQYPMFTQITSTQAYTIYRENETERLISNHNQLLKQYTGADGLKTGYTSISGNCLAGSATRSGLRLIAIVLDSEDTYGEVKQLLDYGFENYKMTRVASFGEIGAKVSIVNGREDQVNLLYGNDVSVLLRLDEEYTLEPTFGETLPQSLPTPISRDTVAATAYFDDGHGFVTAVDLYPAQDVESYTFWGVVKAAFQRVMQVLLV